VGPGRIDLFRVADDGTLRNRTETAARWTAEEDLGDTCASAPAVVTWAPDAMEVFAIFPDGALWDRYWDGTSWHPWASLDGSFDPSSVPAAASRPPGHPSLPNRLPWSPLDKRQVSHRP
jgi:hypothetical protein